VNVSAVSMFSSLGQKQAQQEPQRGPGDMG